MKTYHLPLHSSSSILHSSLFILHFSFFILFACTVSAEKKVYIPDEWKNPWPSDSLLYKESDPDNRYTWSKTRSIESDNVIVFWDKGYGSTLPSKSPTAYRVDEQDLLKKCEAFYDLEINKLGFVDAETTNLRNYKVMVLLNHTTDWVCYGGGYDFEVSALWLGPSACKPVGHSVAHEVGHSFHYMCYADASGNKHTSSTVIGTGFHLPVGNGQAIWEQTAQWQAAQSYPELMFDQSINIFRNSHNLAFSHEWHRYQSYWFHYFLCQYYDDNTTVGQVWRQPMTGASDFNQALMKLKGLSVENLFRLYYDYAAHCATWDIDDTAPYRQPYIGDFTYRCVMLPSSPASYQVALSSTPQSTGFNVIPLNVPKAGTLVTTAFTALPASADLAEGDPAELFNGNSQFQSTTRTNYIRPTNATQRAFRLGYVALMNDGTRQYFHEDKLYGEGTEELTEDVSFTVPEGVSRLFLIVCPAPKSYVQHKWRENISNANHWPYRFSLSGTTLAPQATVYVAPQLDNRPIADATFHFDVTFPATTGGNYTGIAYTIDPQAAATLATAFQLSTAQIASSMQAWSSKGPDAGSIMFYPCKPTDYSIVRRGSTANGYGHWFNAAGNVSDYGSGFLYSEFTPASLTFAIGPYPGKGTNGSSYTICQALLYKKSDTEQAIARFVFNVTLQAGSPTATLTHIDYNDPTTGITPLPPSSHQLPNSSSAADYDLQGRQSAHVQTNNIHIHNGKKYMK